MSTAETSLITSELGWPVPYIPHAISVSMPTWEDNRGFAVGEARVVDALTTGYPRFMPHESVKLLGGICEEKFGNPGERCILVSSAKLAEAMRSFLHIHSPSPVAVRIAHHVLPPPTPDPNHDQVSENQELCSDQSLELDIVFFPAESFMLAKTCWELSGTGVFSRRADRFPFICTLKLLQNWGPGCHFFGFGADDDLSEVRRVAQEAASSGAPITALFCEVPSNPLLRTSNLVELRRIADEFDFLIVVDDTVGNFVNVDIMSYSDIVVTSLTKVFSGSLVLNPERRHYTLLRDHLKATYEQVCWHEDLVRLEVNSRNFAHRIDVMNRNAEAVADWLWSQSEAYDTAHGESQNSNSKKKVITKVFFPKWERRENYDACRRQPASPAVAPLYPSGFGNMLTILFSNESAARAFYDNLGCEKGPTIVAEGADVRFAPGTNFTIACPYTLLSHYSELDWAAEWGVLVNVVRVSIGMEDKETILGWVKYALEAAEKASGSQL
ncbi:hypothetical protein M407DRAFT_210584 [Tulasnella calospora MUT 4182]|uniref:Cystathionine gamma-synthase n=1 Tax=Tulasnella calospora MUT 4182 TaxID=1051891 RepID=A0A0C3LVM2_9AGAM|nr:hypothetical protein M407DRAFT_210584 [Tulasnella calospora MUT 4182]